jgi:hypothetical protein
LASPDEARLNPIYQRTCCAKLAGATIRNDRSDQATAICFGIEWFVRAMRLLAST